MSILLKQTYLTQLLLTPIGKIQVNAQLEHERLRKKAALRKERKIPKISPGTYIFQRPFFEGLIFGGAYLRREIYVSKSTGLALQLEVIYRFCFVLLCI